MPCVAGCLSGCRFLDGREIHETVLTLPTEVLRLAK
jgi:enhancing lycopene biosynthesis protein 2